MIERDKLFDRAPRYNWLLALAAMLLGLGLLLGGCQARFNADEARIEVPL